MLELHAALGLLLAAWPAAREHPDVKDRLILVLRKAMFRPDVGTTALSLALHPTSMVHATRKMLFAQLQDF